MGGEALRRRIAIALLGGALFVPSGLSATPAHAVIGDCTAGYVNGLDDPGGATRIGLHTGYVHCLGTGTDYCVNDDPPEGTLACEIQ